MFLPCGFHYFSNTFYPYLLVASLSFFIRSVCCFTLFFAPSSVSDIRLRAHIPPSMFKQWHSPKTSPSVFIALVLIFPLSPVRLSLPLSLFLSPAALSARYGSPKRQLQFYRYLFVCWLISHGHLILHLFSSVLESALSRLGFILSLTCPDTSVILLENTMVLYP